MSSVWGTSTPPPVSSAVFAISGSATISAPPEKVWQVLFDFDSYKQWNPFVRSQEILNKPDSAPLSVGHRIKLFPVHLPPTMDDGNVGFLQKNSTLVEVTVLDHENHRVAWRLANGLPRWMLDAERWQMITAEEDGGSEGGEMKCKYESYEVFKGILGYVVQWFVGKELKMGVDAMAEELKRRSERNQV
ncbi:hypothetical protein DFJ43DRAFT_1086345 [Lentinula guzmanii]|uniref:Coenzyme Q-binding protein COQ10 START domain-containing protein n=1 Tax=Lentinula guzmanii TaxID=2804957 RepID=A0AA38J869_9AGAR|nr:hypothetical protein DFJ43DRAFT_1086345 [Lentinula guzmanii]